MPNYTLRNKKTKEKFIINCTYTELQDKLANDSNLIQMLVMPAIIGGVGNTHSNSKTSDIVSSIFSKTIQYPNDWQGTHRELFLYCKNLNFKLYPINYFIKFQNL